MGILQSLLILSLSAADFSTLLKDRPFQGAILVSRDAKPVFEHNIGHAAGSVYRIGSISKPFGATAVFTLIADGKLSLDTRACSVLPDCPAAWAPITIEHLLGQTSGLPEFLAQPGYPAIRLFNSRFEEQLKLVSALPLQFSPGERFSYSNTNYVVLARIIETVAGQPWEQYLRERIFRPAGLKQTFVEAATPNIPNLVSGSLTRSPAPVAARPLNMSIPSLAGGLVSTTTDLQLFSQALLSGKLLPASLRDRMWTPAKGPYALGWVRRSINGKTWIGHNGSIDGFHANMFFSPDNNTFIAILSSVQDQSTDALMLDFIRLASGEAPAPINTSLDDYLGTFEFVPQFSIVVTRDGNQLITQATNQQKIPVFPEGPDAFTPKVIPATLQFIRENGKVTGLILKQNGREMRARKL